MVTADDVYAQARSTYNRVGVRELGRTYARMSGGRWEGARRWAMTPEPVAGIAVAALLGPALDRAGPGAAGVLRVRFHDPQCGVGTGLVMAARALTRAYTSRLCGGEPEDELLAALAPSVILHCIFGTDPDPVAADLARLALSLETGGVLPAQALHRHIVCAERNGYGAPPALADRPGVHVLAGARKE